MLVKPLTCSLNLAYSFTIVSPFCILSYWFGSSRVSFHQLGLHCSCNSTTFSYNSFTDLCAQIWLISCMGSTLNKWYLTFTCHVFTFLIPCPSISTQNFLIDIPRHFKTIFHYESSKLVLKDTSMQCFHIMSSPSNV